MCLCQSDWVSATERVLKKGEWNSVIIASGTSELGAFFTDCAWASNVKDKDSFDPLQGVWLTGDLTNHNVESAIFIW